MVVHDDWVVMAMTDDDWVVVMMTGWLWCCHGGGVVLMWWCRCCRKQDMERSDILYQILYMAHRRKRELSRKRWLKALRLVCDICYIAKIMSIR